MCGIAGFFLSKEQSKEIKRELLHRMESALAHRGPDDSGIWSDEKTTVGLAHRRLSILDLSPLGHQPMESQNHRFVISFNGEIYNFLEIKRELEDLGHPFYSRSDTEVLLEAFNQWGIISTLPKLNGMFAFAVWDRQQNILTLARDRIGIKPLYYGISQGDLFFASELKGILAAVRDVPPIDEQALSLYFRYGYIPAPFSIYQNTRKLKAGHYVEFRSPHSEPVSHPYWTLHDAFLRGQKNPISGAEAVNELDVLLGQAVKNHMISDAPIGAFLSGGIDSSLVATLMQIQSSTPIKTFSIGFDAHEFNEAPFARAVSDVLKTDHTELYVTSQDALAVVPQIQTLYDEPFSDSSQIPTYLLSKLAKSKVTVALSGDGGDELFSGYTLYRYVQWAERLRSLPSPIQNIVSGLLSALNSTVPLGTHQKQRIERLVRFLKTQSFKELYESAVSLWKGDPAYQSLLGNPLAKFNALAPWLPTNDQRFLMMGFDLDAYLPEDILTKVDRASMSHSLEVRVPVLDYRVIEFAFRLSTSDVANLRNGKLILKKILERYLSPSLFRRPKKGFAIPVDHWLRGPLRIWAEELLNRKAVETHGLLNHSIIAQKWNEHVEGSHNHGQLLWALLMFQDWFAHRTEITAR